MRALAPFANGQYRILVAALLASLLGAGMWLIALLWQVIELGGGPTQVSVVAAATSVGMLLAILFGGATADRIPQKRILLVVESVKAVAITATALLALSGALELWHLVISAFVLGLADGFFYPAYSALLPSILVPEHLLAANGIEGTLRPALMQAAGPAIASVIIMVWSPGVAMLTVAVFQAAAALTLILLRSIPITREIDRDVHPLRSFLQDIGGGFSYMVKTPWLLGTLLYSLLFVLVTIGPIEVLLPFAVRDQIGLAPGFYAAVLAAYGIGSAIGSIVTASFRLPRRYLTYMNLAWGLGGIPLIFVGYTEQLWVMILWLFIVGFAWASGMVVWGTLLQRRVPTALLGRISSLDFFVSLMLMPVSMALAGPVGEAFGTTATFIAAGLIPAVLGVLTIAIFRMPADEIAHPLDIVPEKVAIDD